MTQTKLFGGIEGGGTKFVCMVAADPQNIVDEIRFHTTTPSETIEQAVAFFEKYAHTHGLAAIGMASFGPVDLDKASPTFGHITTTPKPGWAFTDTISQLRQALSIPVAFELDVNAAAFGEYYWNAENRNLDPLVYFTIGTGIGAGVIVHGKLVHGLVHPEAGHMRIPHDLRADPFPGACPYHGDCFEGLACGPAIQQRWGQRAEKLPASHPAWDLEASYIAQALNNTICGLSPKRIVLGGGVMQQAGLVRLIQQKVQKLLNNYIHSTVITEQIDQYIVLPSLGNRSGVLGAIALARQEIEGK
jgi:fructokinase